MNLSSEQLRRIGVLRSEGRSVRAIAAATGVHRSSVGRAVLLLARADVGAGGAGAVRPGKDVPAVVSGAVCGVQARARSVPRVLVPMSEADHAAWAGVERLVW